MTRKSPNIVLVSAVLWQGEGSKNKSSPIINLDNYEDCSLTGMLSIHKNFPIYKKGIHCIYIYNITEISLEFELDGPWKWPDFKGNKKNFSDSNKIIFLIWQIISRSDLYSYFTMRQYFFLCVNLTPMKIKNGSFFNCFHRWCWPQSES